MSTRERRERSDAADAQLQELFLFALSVHGVNEDEIALAAVGGYGRGELSPGSDLDITFICSPSLNDEKKSAIVNAVLYPLWDKGWLVDHSTRTRNEVRANAEADLKVLLGLLDIRYLAGARSMVESAARDASEMWERNFTKNAPAIRANFEEREQVSGELAFLLEPDLKEARGGLRDIQLLRAISRVATVPISLDRLSAAEALLLRVRDTLHTVSGRKRDQLLFMEQDKVAAALEFTDADALMRAVAEAARTVDYISALTWNQLDRIINKRSRFARSKIEAVTSDIEIEGSELRLTQNADYRDPTLALKAAAIAAQRGLTLSLDSILRLADAGAAFDGIWPRKSREDLVSLLGAGAEMISIFELLDQEGFIERWIPEWGRVRYLPQRNVLHRHTVDRHMLEVVSRASTQTRHVHRPDLLLVAALFHDIGKGDASRDHSDYGEELVAGIAERIGFPKEDIRTLQLLIKHHLLLPLIATRRDLDDPATISTITSVIPDIPTLELLHALSIADGEATGKAAWSQWKAGLVSALVERSKAAMQGGEPALQLDITERQARIAAEKRLAITIEPREDSFEIEIIVPDRTGLLALVAGTLAISKCDIRSARTKTVNDVAVMTWLVSVDQHQETPNVDRLTTTLNRVLSGELDLTSRIEERIANYRKYPGIPVPPPRVVALNDHATSATVLEVAMHDRPGVLYTISKTISRFGVDIQAAIVATLGAEAFDTLYITDLAGRPLPEDQSKALARQIERYLETL